MDDTQKDGSIWGNGLGRRTLITGAAAAAFGLTLGDMMGLSNGSLAFAAGTYGTVVWPVNPHPTPTGQQVYGSPRSYPGGHRGSDYGVARGTAVVAIAAGRVSGRDVDRKGSEIGNWVEIEHAGFTSRYIHFNEAPHVAYGAQVSAGQRIGSAGDTGTAAIGVHLHIEIYDQLVRQDPHAWLTANVGAGSATPTKEIEVPDYSLVRGQNDNRVYLSVNRLQRRWIESEAALADVRYVLRGVNAPAADRPVEVVANPDAYGVIITATPTLDQIRQVIREEVAAGR